MLVCREQQGRNAGLCEGDRQRMQLYELWTSAPYQDDALDRLVCGSYDERFPFAACQFDSNVRFSLGG